MPASIVRPFVADRHGDGDKDLHDVRRRHEHRAAA
jgi:hypothetical protein